MKTLFILVFSLCSIVLYAQSIHIQKETYMVEYYNQDEAIKHSASTIQSEKTSAWMLSSYDSDEYIIVLVEYDKGEYTVFLNNIFKLKTESISYLRRWYEENFYKIISKKI